MEYKNINVEINNKIAIIRLDRPKALNALNKELLTEFAHALSHFDSDDNIHVIVLTGSEKAFAAGADIKEMADLDAVSVTEINLFSSFADAINNTRKVIIAAVSGYALGGGCELAMACDFIIASKSAKFSQPEITIGTIPGMGGTQRLTLAIGKSKAMEMCLTGRMMDADEAERSGLVARVVEDADLIEETMKTAEKIASHSLPTTRLVKQAVNQSMEAGLKNGLEIEKQLFRLSFSLADKKEGMQAFVEKRAPKFNNK